MGKNNKKNKKQQPAAPTRQEKQLAKAIAAAGKKVNATEYNQILKIAGDATSAAKAIASSGLAIGSQVQSTINQIASTYDPATKGGKGLGTKDAEYLQSLGVSNSAIKQAGADADRVSRGFYNTYKTGTTGEVKQINDWLDSVNQQNQTLIDSINTQISNNTTQQNDYLPLIEQLTTQLSNISAKQTDLQGVPGAYAVGATQSAPAQGAKTTAEIGRRRKPLNSSLSISPAASSGAGAGLNIAA